jgi:GAF domain-containing protein
MALPQDQGHAKVPQGAGLLARVWGWIATPHPAVTGVGARRRAQLTMGLALAITATNAAGLFAALGVRGADLSTVVLAGLVATCFIAYGLSRTRFYYVGSVLLPIGLSLSAYGLVFAGSQNPSASLYSAIPAALAMGSGLLPLGGLVTLTLANVVLTGLLPQFVSAITMANAGRDAGVFLSVGLLLTIITAFRNGLERARLRELREANQGLIDIRATLEQRVTDRTAELERRSAYLTAAADVSTAASSVLDADQLMREVVELIRDRFGLYYVGLFRVDAGGEWAVLQAGTGEAGQAMLARSHRIRIGEGMIGWSISNARARVASQAEADAVRLATSELPDTRSEAALPLRTRGQVVGALTVQSDQADAFDEDAISALQAMADQVAVALGNARLFAESQAVLEAERRAYGELTREAWRDLLRSRPGVGYRYEGQAVQPALGDWAPEMTQAVQEAAVVEECHGSEAAMAVPLQVRGHVIGVLHVSRGQDDAEWSSDETAMVEAVAEQLGIALESARLHEDTQRSAARERTIAEVGARVRASLDLEAMLRTAASEMRQALNLGDLVIRLAPPGAVNGSDEGRT